MKVVGVDGCPAGWVAVTIDDSGWTCAVHPTIEAVWAASSDAARIWVDMPIGLPDTTMRDVENACKQVLKGRRNSVFATAPRSAIYAPDYITANNISKALTTQGISKQSWAISEKIRELDSFLQQNPDATQLMVESHPEVVFWALNGSIPLKYGKKVVLGVIERLEIINHRYAPSQFLLESSRYASIPAKLTNFALDDLIDAFCLAIGARFEESATLPPEPKQDMYGLPMQVLYPDIKSGMYPSSPKLIQLHHVQITVPSAQIDEARAFYLDLLGLREIPKPDSLKKRGGFWVELGGQEVHISIEDGVDRTLTKAHIAYQVDNLTMWREKFEARGIQTLGNEPIPGYDRFEFRDPFGNRVEFIMPLG